MNTMSFDKLARITGAGRTGLTIGSPLRLQPKKPLKNIVLPKPGPVVLIQN